MINITTHNSTTHWQHMWSYTTRLTWICKLLPLPLSFYLSVSWCRCTNCHTFGQNMSNSFNVSGLYSYAISYSCLKYVYLTCAVCIPSSLMDGTHSGGWPLADDKVDVKRCKSCLGSPSSSALLRMINK